MSAPVVPSGEIPRDPDGRAAVRAGRTFVISAGIVAHNEEANLEAAVASLLAQRLPDGVRWQELTIVASGCTDRTVGIAERLAADDPRVRVVVEPERGGKARALRAVLQRATGDALVLLNADARALPGAVEALLATARTAPSGRPYAVMGRPLPRSPDRPNAWSRAVATLWELHHVYHADLATRGGGAHLSDELLLLGLPPSFDLPDGTVNDGSYIGVWLAGHGGTLLYAERAWVETEAPGSIRDHLLQRRRIHFGNLEVAAALGSAPSTLVGASVREPSTFVRVMREVARRRAPQVLALGILDAIAGTLARWDRLPPRRSYVRWPRIEGAGPDPRPERSGAPGPTFEPAGSEPFGDRWARLAAVAAEFRVPAGAADVLPFLGADAPPTAAELDRWRSDHRFAPVGEETGLGTSAGPDRLELRRARAAAYVALAERRMRGRWRSWQRWVRLVAVSGSTAYGAPDSADDLDLFVVARRGAVWGFLAHALFSERLAQLRSERSEPELCLNHVWDTARAEREFERARGLLFAREAMTLRPVWGAAYYRTLLERGTWIRRLLPRLPPVPAPADDGGRTSERVPLALLVASALAFPILAPYLQLVGLRRNARFRARGESARAFRTRTGFGGFVLASERFERLRSIYDGPAPVARGSVPAPVADAEPTRSPPSVAATPVPGR